MSSGVYKITNKINGKFYIGSAVNCFKRWCKKYNEHLESAFKKYGKENFIFEIIENVEDSSKLIEREQYYMDLLKPEYNKRSIASSNLGIKASDETRYKLSVARRKRTTKPETCEKISASLKGREIKWKEKIAEANSGENNYNYGNELSEEWKKKISDSLKNRKKSKEHKQNISKGKKGIKFSEEHRKKLSEAAKKRNKKTSCE